MHMTFVILVGIDVCLKECIRIFYFFCNTVFEAHIIEQTHRNRLVYSHVAVFVDLVISERDQACRDLNCNKISHMQLSSSPVAFSTVITISLRFPSGYTWFVSGMIISQMYILLSFYCLLSSLSCCSPESRM